MSPRFFGFGARRDLNRVEPYAHDLEPIAPAPDDDDESAGGLLVTP